MRDFYQSCFLFRSVPVTMIFKLCYIFSWFHLGLYKKHTNTTCWEIICQMIKLIRIQLRIRDFPLGRQLTRALFSKNVSENERIGPVGFGRDGGWGWVQEGECWWCPLDPPMVSNCRYVWGYDTTSMHKTVRLSGNFLYFMYLLLLTSAWDATISGCYKH